MTKLSEIYPGHVDTVLYTPGMMKFNGTDSYYSLTYTSSGNKITGVAQFRVNSETGAGYQTILLSQGTTPRTRLAFYIGDNDNASAEHRDKMVPYVTNSAGTVICRLVSLSNVTDGQVHTIFFAYDGDNGLATFIIDGQDEDDAAATGRTLTTGTLESGASSVLQAGAANTGNWKTTGGIGFFGHAEAYLTNWEDFMEADGRPKNISENSWAEWGGQPLFWNQHGDMENNLGSAGDMTKNGTIELAEGGLYAVRADAALTRPLFIPGMMEFDGSTGYYEDASITSTGNKVTVLFRFAVVPFTGDRNVIPIAMTASGGARFIFNIFSSDNSDSDKPNKMQVYVQSSVGAYLAILVTPEGYVDGQLHTCMFSFDGDAGTAQFIIDGTNADDTGNADRSAPTTGTLSTTSTSLTIGAGAAGTTPADCDIGFLGHADAYLTNWADFMESNGDPKQINETAWTEWGGQPLFWNQHGDMTNNLGSAGDMTKNGTIEVAPGTLLPITPPIDYVRYAPAMMDNTGGGRFRLATSTAAGNKQTVIMRVLLGDQTGTTYICNVADTSHKILMALSGTTEKLVVTVYNSATTVVCKFQSTNTLWSNTIQNILFAYDGDAGTAAFIINGEDADDQVGYGGRVAPTTGTLETGTMKFAFMDEYYSDNPFVGQMGFCGYSELYLPNAYDDFFDAYGNPIEQDETTWANSGWTAQPLVWNEHGDLANNLGSNNDFTKNGTVEIGKGGN